MSSAAATPLGDRALRAARWYALALRDQRRAVGAAAEDPEVAVFFYQQAAEKALKAVLVAADQAFGRTHSLDRLLVLAGRLDPGFLQCPGDPERVSAYAIRFRYPAEDGEDFADAEDVATAREVADWLVATAGGSLAGSVAELAARIAAERSRGDPS